jgi:glycosyltransferase involved in cell wall biosynthesis
MKISVITPSYNQGAFIEQTIRSVLDQGIEGLEYIIIDGGSTDGTLDILRRYEGRIKWISEPDEGLADAVNKGIGMATGEIIGWLNSDDLYLENSLSTIKDYFIRQQDCQWLYGKCKIIDRNGKEIWKPITWYKNQFLKNYNYRKLFRENYISQPAVFFRKSFFEKVGPIRTDLKYAMDYNLWLRFGNKSPAHYVDQYLSLFRRHSESKSVNEFKSQFLEQYQVAIEQKPEFIDRFIHLINVYKIMFVYILFNRR